MEKKTLGRLQVEHQEVMGMTQHYEKQELLVKLALVAAKVEEAYYTPAKIRDVLSQVRSFL